MPADTEKPICVRCGLEVRVNRETYEILERMHWVCFHFEFEHTGFDPDEECDVPDCPSSLFTSPPARAGLLAPDPAFQELDAAELLAMVPCAAESVLRRGRAAMELGRRAADNPALLTEVAALIRDPANRRPHHHRPGLRLPAGNSRARRRRQRPDNGAGPRTGRRVAAPPASPTSPA
jgi:hypothetical protein